MKNISQLVVQQMRSTANLNQKQSSDQALNEKIIELVNKIFDTLLAIYPSFRYQLTAEQLSETKRQWVRAFFENKIWNVDQVKEGLKQARLSESGFMPTVGQFMQWCKSRQHPDLPTPEELFCRYKRYLREFNKFDDISEHDWKNNAEYHLVVKVSNAARYQNLSDEKLKKVIPDLLSEMAGRLNNGEKLSDPVRCLPVIKAERSLSSEQISEKLNHLRSILRG